MPDTLLRVAVHTDFPYTSLDPEKRYVVWADRAWHSVPAILLTEHLNLTGIAQGGNRSV
jgi:hypothetical protein